MKGSRDGLLDNLQIETISDVETVAAGACSTQVSLRRAADLLATKRIRRCVIGAVDTQLQLRAIRWHEDNRRLKCSYVTDGLMPGEAACFLVVEPAESAFERNASVIARILSVDTSSEHATILSDKPNTATGLTRVVRAALTDADLDSAQVGMVWSDLNGESYRSREWAFTEVRLAFNSDTELMHPADCHGDLGAATDASLLALAALGHGTGWSQGRPSLVFSGSEGGVRAATVLAAPQGTLPLLQVSQGVPRVLSTSFQVPEPPNPAEHFSNSEDPKRTYFDWQLREEHRDELASLHYQRKAILHDGTIPWPRLREPEQRMLNHLDALVASGPKSMAAVAAGVSAEEEGLCFAGAFLIGCLPLQKNFAPVRAALEAPEEPRVAGIAAGLLHAPASEALDDFVRSLIDDEHTVVQAMAVTVAAARRIDIRPRLLSLFAATNPALLKSVAEACRSMRFANASSELQTLLSLERPDLRRAAMLALLRVAPAQTAAYARSAIARNNEFGGALATCVGIAGQLSDARMLIELFERDSRDVDSIEALGILGSAQSVPWLIRLLGSVDENVKVSAGNALDLIAGLHTTERVTLQVSSEVDGQESTEDVEVERVNTSMDFWTNWWKTQRSQLPPNVRWRRGEPFSIGVCIEELADPKSTYRARQRAHLELSTRASADIPFEPDWFVQRQEASIDAWRLWWTGQADR
jgi:uncharacterized protein (TIGR02270 family)